MATCSRANIEALGRWIVEYPGMLLDDTKLKYFGWALSDPELAVRKATFTTLQAIYKACFDEEFEQRRRPGPKQADELHGALRAALLRRPWTWTKGWLSRRSSSCTFCWTRASSARRRRGRRARRRREQGGRPSSTRTRRGAAARGDALCAVACPPSADDDDEEEEAARKAKTGSKGKSRVGVKDKEDEDVQQRSAEQLDEPLAFCDRNVNTKTLFTVDLLVEAMADTKEAEVLKDWGAITARPEDSGADGQGSTQALSEQRVLILARIFKAAELFCGSEDAVALDDDGEPTGKGAGGERHEVVQTPGKLSAERRGAGDEPQRPPHQDAAAAAGEVPGGAEHRRAARAADLPPAAPRHQRGPVQGVVQAAPEAAAPAADHRLEHRRGDHLGDLRSRGGCRAQSGCRAIQDIAVALEKKVSELIDASAEGADGAAVASSSSSRRRRGEGSVGGGGGDRRSRRTWSTP